MFCWLPVPTVTRADSRFAPSQWETTLLCNDVSHCLGANLEPDLSYYFRFAGAPWHDFFAGTNIGFFSYLEGNFQVDIFMMDLWVYRDSIYIYIVGTLWHFNCYFTIVLNVVYGLGKGGHKYPWQIIPGSFVAWGVINIGTKCVKHL